MTPVSAALLLGGLLLSACHARGQAAAAAPSVCAASNGVGRLTLQLNTTPPVPETSEALVRLESETERSTVRVNAVLGTTFELRPGRYQLSISLPGFNSAERSASIECGSARTLIVPLARKR
ncbi:hypothetical protein [Gemmatimonas sp.]|uniref:hypothetical protein n=1 Tax=Gemmatimonas sp. TaxID=1962908 RepID=UPI0039831BE8